MEAKWVEICSRCLMGGKARVKVWSFRWRQPFCAVCWGTPIMTRSSQFSVSTWRIRTTKCLTPAGSVLGRSLLTLIHSLDEKSGRKKWFERSSTSRRFKNWNPLNDCCNRFVIAIASPKDEITHRFWKKNQIFFDNATCLFRAHFTSSPVEDESIKSTFMPLKNFTTVFIYYWTRFFFKRSCGLWTVAVCFVVAWRLSRDIRMRMTWNSKNPFEIRTFYSPSPAVAVASWSPSACCERFAVHRRNHLSEARIRRVVRLVFYMSVQLKIGGPVAFVF